MDAYNGWILFNNPGHEHTVTHFDGRPDECTIFKFSKEFYETLQLDFHYARTRLRDDDVHSLLIPARAEFEHMHFLILKGLRENKMSRMLVDSLVLEMVQSTLDVLLDVKKPAMIPERLKRNHLPTLEKAKHFINEKFKDDISLIDVANNCFISPFHFSRVFKSFASYFPYQYLVETHLKNAEH